MKKILIIPFALALSMVMLGKTQVKILEDHTVIQQENDVMKVLINQTFSGVPLTPCISDFTVAREKSENPTWKEKIKYFFYDVYDQLSWKRVAYGFGGLAVGIGTYKIGKKARREHYGQSVYTKISHWWNKK